MIRTDLARRSPFTLAAHAADAALTWLSGAASDLVAAVAPGWVAGEAHLAGKAPVARAVFAELAPIDLRLDALEREIERRRRG